MLNEVIREGRLDEVNRLLANSLAQAELNEALGVASFEGNEAIVNSLLDHGANPNAIPEHSWPAIFCAVEQGNLSMVRLLVTRGADPNLRLTDNFSPLHLSVDVEGDIALQNQRTPQADMTKLLLELGADPCPSDMRGQFPMDIAKYYNHFEAIALLQNHTQKL